MKILPQLTQRQCKQFTTQDLSERLDLEITYTKSMLQVLCEKNLVRKELHYSCPECHGQNILSESVLSKQSHRTSYFEFLYEQTKFIKKRWWILQGCVLMCLWIWLSNYTSDIKDMMRIMGISATIFVVLIIPEIWKNRRNGAIEIEQASYYTLRQICTARMLMFGVVDLVIVMVFLAITYQTTILSLSDLVVNFLLPVNVSCCICFRVLYSRWEKSEYIAVLSCLVWVGLWMMIVANDVIYQKIVTPVWVAMLILTFVYFIFCVQKSLLFDEKILEDYTYEIRI